MKHLRDRLGEPLLLNAISLFVYLFGSYRAKIDFDLVHQRPHAFGLLNAANRAVELGIDHIIALEFGVASGRGLINMGRIAEKITEMTGVRIEVVGFDTGEGLPGPRDYRDHPELYQTGDYPPLDKQQIISLLPGNTRIIYGDIADTIASFTKSIDSVIGFVKIDVDLYWSSVACFTVFDGSDPSMYLPVTPIYLDDVNLETQNPWCGEFLAVDEFNESHPMRKIAPFHTLRHQRVFKRPSWIDQMFMLHVLDHPRRTLATAVEREIAVVKSPHFTS
jgi:hypothetical protein